MNNPTFRKYIRLIGPGGQVQEEIGLGRYDSVEIVRDQLLERWPRSAVRVDVVETVWTRPSKSRG